MKDTTPKVMRDFLIEELYNRMFSNKDILFLSADFGSPVLDKLRDSFQDRFINVGIAEQNLINVATGLALEGFVVYAYGIAPFITMRAYEQIRINLSLLSHTRDININLIGVGAGLSYDFTGPTHHCLEDLAIMQLLPNIVLFSPSDTVTIEKFVDYSIAVKKPKYIRLDGKPLPDIYTNSNKIKMEEGFHEIIQGDSLCFVSTGYMTHKSLRIADKLKRFGIKAGVIDMFLLKPIDEYLLYETLKRYTTLVTMEEAFVKGGGLGGLVMDVVAKNGLPMVIHKLGFDDMYSFEIGDREFLHKTHGLSDTEIIDRIKNSTKQEEGAHI
jgi:transketolase